MDGAISIKKSSSFLTSHNMDYHLIPRLVLVLNHRAIFPGDSDQVDFFSLRRQLDS